jgi:hypothetical protein
MEKWFDEFIHVVTKEATKPHSCGHLTFSNLASARSQRPSRITTRDSSSVPTVGPLQQIIDAPQHPDKFGTSVDQAHSYY